MKVWTPRSSTVSASDPQAVAPGNLSPRGQVEFGTQVARMLADRHVRWVGPSPCPRVHTSAAPTDGTGPTTAGQPTTARHATAAPDSAPGTASSTGNWSGFTSSDGNFTGASMEWTVPAVADQSGSNNPSVSIWPGIGTGGSASDSLIQAGTQTDSNGSIYAWTEIVPGESEQPISGFTVSAGDEMAVNVGFDPETDVATFFLVDYTTDVATSPITESVVGMFLDTASTAEWVVERPVSCLSSACIFSPMMDFGSSKITYGAAEQTSSSGVTTGKYIGGFTDYNAINMRNCADTLTLAAPSYSTTDLETDGDFTDNWENLGTADPAACIWRVSPANTAFTASLASSSVATFTDKTSGTSIGCTGSTLSGTTGADSVAGVPGTLATITGATFTGPCISALGTWAIDLPTGSEMNLNGDIASTDGVTTGDLSGFTADVAAGVGLASCAFDLSGSVPADDLTFTNPSTLTITSADLTVLGASSGCPEDGVSNNDTVTFSGDYTITSPSAGITIIPGPPPSDQPLDVTKLP